MCDQLCLKSMSVVASSSTPHMACVLACVLATNLHCMCPQAHTHHPAAASACCVFWPCRRRLECQCRQLHEHMAVQLVDVCLLPRSSSLECTKCSQIINLSSSSSLCTWCWGELCTLCFILLGAALASCAAVFGSLYVCICGKLVHTLHMLIQYVVLSNTLCSM